VSISLGKHAHSTPFYNINSRNHRLGPSGEKNTGRTSMAHTFPFGIPSKNKFVYFFWLKSAQILWETMSNFWGVEAF